MPGPLLVAGIAAAGQASGSIINAATQAAQNRKSRNFAREMYGRQRADALEDWNRETSYNSPQMQMQRLRDAGLNPNLVYGDSVVQSAPSTRSSSAPGWNPKAPEYGNAVAGVGQSLAMYYDLKFRQAQTDNVMAATDVAMEDKVLKQAQAYATLVGAGKTDLEARRLLAELPNVQKLSDYSVDKARADIDARLAETRVLLNRDEREAISTTQSIKESVARILRMRYENAKSEDDRRLILNHIRSMTYDNELKALDIDLKKKGIQPHDQLWQRKVADYLNGLPGMLKKAANSPMELMNYFFGK